MQFTHSQKLSHYLISSAISYGLMILLCAPLMSPVAAESNATTNVSTVWTEFTSFMAPDSDLFSGAFQSGARWLQSDLITLQSTASVLETYEPISSISVAEDDQTLQVVSSSTADIETYRNEPDGSLRSLGKLSGSTIKSPSGDSVQVNEEKVAVLDADGKIASQFTTTLPAISTAFLNSGDVAIASPSNKNLIQVYSPTGKLLNSFGALKERDRTNQFQNRFLNRGKILVDADGSVYYVYNYMPLIQKYTPDGKLQYEVEVKGEAIDLQQAVARQLFNIKKSQQVGAIDIITAATIGHKTGHLWIAMNGSSTGGVVYEYNQHGQKLHEYALHSIFQVSSLAQNITGVRDIAVTSSWIYILTHQQQVYCFERNKSEQANINLPKARPQPALLARTVAFAPSSLPKSAAVQTSCPTPQAWNDCNFVCPGIGTCTGNPPVVPPPNTSNGSTQDCKALLMSSLSPGYTVVSSACTQNPAGTAMHTRGGCKNDVTICRSGTNSTHSITLDCPAQSCETAGGGGGYSCPYGEEPCNSPEVWSWVGCSCIAPNTPSPIILDVLGNGFNLTSAANGVNFDLNRDGNAEHLSWTAANSDAPGSRSTATTMAR